MFTKEQTRRRMVCTSGGHNKFYEVEIRTAQLTNINNSYDVWIHWGRIGNKGKWQLKRSFSSWASAASEAQKIVNSKKDRGYILQEANSTESTPQTKEEKKVDRKFARFIAILE